MCKNEKDKKFYALKRIDKIAVKSLGPRYEFMIRTEIQILKKMEKSAFVLTLYDDFEDNSYIYLITEYCRGGDLEKLLQIRYYLSE